MSYILIQLVIDQLLNMSILLTTGATKRNSVLNIYDLAGNVWEWTLEKSPKVENPCSFKGGGFSTEKKEELNACVR